MFNYYHFISLLLLLLSSQNYITFVSSTSLTATVQPNTEECFTENANVGEKVMLSFSVVAGGALDIDLKVMYPDGSLVYETTRQQEGSIHFVALQEGVVDICIVASIFFHILTYVYLHIYSRIFTYIYLYIYTYVHMF